MAVRPTIISRFPVDSGLQELCRLPWSVVVAPFSSANEHGSPLLHGKEGHLLPRCENCYGYFNTYCELDQWSWTCALSGALNGLSTIAIDRYSQVRSCPEMCSSFIDLEIPVEGSEREGMLAWPVYVAAVDLSSSEELLELVKSTILAALEGEHRLTVDLEDAMPLLSFLAPVESCNDRIAAALETLKPTTSWEKTTAAGQVLDSIFLCGQGFGVSMDALINYLSSEYGNTFALARIFAFLSGAPDYGVGQLDTRRYGDQYASKGEDADRALLPEQTSFYKDLAANAVQSGACVDIFAITNEYTDLASLKFLSIESGGSLFLYSGTDDSILPQDIYQMLSHPYAFGCVLRLRTSSEFIPAFSYGHFSPDPQYENVQHVICCDSFATYAYDFEFADNAGFSRHSEPHFFHVAFQYSIIVPCEETSNVGPNSGTGLF